MRTKLLRKLRRKARREYRLYPQPEGWEVRYYVFPVWFFNDLDKAIKQLKKMRRAYIIRGIANARAKYEKGKKWEILKKLDI